ncbi:MAG: DNA polymerase III subunit delta [Clostridiales bacterium]|nr:DNA polymerase III subunit delta [Clostridiales bacterium]
MITYDVFEKNIKNNIINNSYVFCGHDEDLIKESVELLNKKVLNTGLRELNYIRFDGNNVNFEEILNASETMPFMGEKKIVEIFRGNFLADKSDSAGTKMYNDIKEYLKNIPSYTIIIIYYVFPDKRDTPKKNKKIMALDKITTVVNIEKLKKDKFLRKVQDIFIEKNKEIGNLELRYFCEKVPNNFNIINNEVDKLISYTIDRKITKEDINLLIPAKSEEDIFDLVDLISQKKVEKAIDVLDEILFKSDQHMLIIISIENQFRRLYEIKLGLQKGKKLNDFVSEFRLPSFVCEKLINLCRKFSIKELGEIIKLCIETEVRLKSTTVDKRMELELLIINTVMIKK